MEEIWKDIEGYEGLYQVSNFGRVKSLRKIVYYSDGRVYSYPEKIKSQIKDSKKAYWVVNLSDNRKTPRKKSFYVHVLVAKAFVPNPNNYPLVMHKDQKNLRFDNECNNNAENLEWGTYKDNAPQDVGRQRMSVAGKNKIIKESTRKKLSQAGKGVAHCQKPVICEGKVFDNIKLCAIYYNIQPYTMRRWLRKNLIPKEFKEKGLAYIY